MLLKVCGMKYEENIAGLMELKPDYIGFIFYEKSKRYAGQELQSSFMKTMDPTMEKVGVFVNHPVAEVIRICDEFDIRTVQLHGEETPQQCRQLKEVGFKVVKAFSIDSGFDFSLLRPYVAFCDFFLFDTKGDNYGGTGRSFDWSMLENYDNSLPFFLSGGIDEGSLERLRLLPGLRLHALDINSRFEISPGLKDTLQIKSFMEKMNEIKLNIKTRDL